MFLVPYVLFCFPGEECTWWTFHSCVQLNVLDVVSVSERSSVTRSAHEKQLLDPILRSCKTQQQDFTRQAQIGNDGLKGGMNKVLVIYLQGISYILHSKHCKKLKKMLSLLSERGVPESSRNFVKFGPHRMSTGELKTMYHTNPTLILTHSHTQLLTHSHTHPLNTQTPKHSSTLTLPHSGGGRQEENECERSENPLAVWLRNVPVWLTEERRWAIGHQPVSLCWTMMMFWSCWTMFTFLSTRFYHEIQSWPDCDPSNSHWFKNKQDNTWVGVRSVVGRFLRMKSNLRHQVRVGHCLVSQPAGSQRFSRRRKSTFCSRVQGRCLGEAEGRPPHQ